MTDVEHIKKIIPLVTCVITFRQNVCKVMLGINVSNLNRSTKINPARQAIANNSVGF